MRIKISVDGIYTHTQRTERREEPDENLRRRRRETKTSIRGGFQATSSSVTSDLMDFNIMFV